MSDVFFCYSSQASCSTYYKSLPNLEWKVDSTTYTMPPQAYTYSTTIGFNGYNSCTVMVSFNAVSTDTHTLGEPFLRQFVSTFDFDKNKVSFAQNVNA